MKENYVKFYNCDKIVRFGHGRRYRCHLMMEVLIFLRRINNEEDVMKVKMNVIRPRVPLLCGKETLKLWGIRLNMEGMVMEIWMNGHCRDYRMIITAKERKGSSTLGSVSCENMDCSTVLPLTSGNKSKSRPKRVKRNCYGKRMGALEVLLKERLREEGGFGNFCSEGDSTKN